jgi:hypothetical protein
VGQVLAGNSANAELADVAPAGIPSSNAIPPRPVRWRASQNG